MYEAAVMLPSITTFWIEVWSDLTWTMSPALRLTLARGVIVPGTGSMSRLVAAMASRIAIAFLGFN